MGRRYKIPGRSKYYVERDKYGRFKKWTRIMFAQRADKRIVPAKRVVKPGYGHRGDQKKRRR